MSATLIKKNYKKTVSRFTMPHTIQDLPKILTLLPVNGAVIFPKGQLPLPILTPKHFSIIADVWNTHKFIGLVQLDTDSSENHSKPTFYKAGSVGKILDMNEFDDGRFYVTVAGICRFNIARNLFESNDIYRAEVDYTPYENDLVDEADFTFDRTKLLFELGKYFKRLDIDANWDEIQHVSNEKLITALAMACPFTSSERQALLQCASIREQSKLITSFVEMANMEPNIFKVTCH